LRLCSTRVLVILAYPPIGPRCRAINISEIQSYDKSCFHSKGKLSMKALLSHELTFNPAWAYLYSLTPTIPYSSSEQEFYKVATFAAPTTSHTDRCSHPADRDYMNMGSQSSKLGSVEIRLQLLDMDTRSIYRILQSRTE